MATYLEKLKTIRDQLADRIIEVSASVKPSYSVDGQSISWESYLATLNNQLAVINAQINAAEPFELESEGYVGGW
jgi:hypothetical protein